MHTVQLHAHAAGVSCATITGALFLACAAAYALVPDATLVFFNLLFHGLDIRKIAVPMTWSGVITGLLIAVIGAYALTWAWAALYNRLAGRPGTVGESDCCAK